MTKRTLVGKSPKKSPEQKIKEIGDALNYVQNIQHIPEKKKNIIIMREKLEKVELLKLMKEKGKESIDSDHEALIKYIFPKNDLTPQENRNKNYTRRRILTAIDLILAYCDIYPKKEVKK